MNSLGFLFSPSQSWLSPEGCWWAAAPVSWMSRRSKAHTQPWRAACWRPRPSSPKSQLKIRSPRRQVRDLTRQFFIRERWEVAWQPNKSQKPQRFGYSQDECQVFTFCWINRSSNKMWGLRASSGKKTNLLRRNQSLIVIKMANIKRDTWSRLILDTWQSFSIRGGS